MKTTVTRPYRQKIATQSEIRVEFFEGVTSSCAGVIWSQAPAAHQETFGISTLLVSDVYNWLSKDPIGISGALNQYVFCGNNGINFVDPLGLATVYVIKGGGAGADKTTSSVSKALTTAGWTVKNVTSSEFRNLPTGSEVNGILAVGHGDANWSANSSAVDNDGISISDVANVLGRTGGKLDIAIILSCHGHDFINQLYNQSLMSKNAQSISYWGYSAHSAIRTGFITRRIKKCKEGDVSYGNLIQDGLGMVATPVASWITEKMYNLYYWVTM